MARAIAMLVGEIKMFSSSSKSFSKIVILNLAVAPERVGSKDSSTCSSGLIMSDPLPVTGTPHPDKEALKTTKA